jgi:hypothetical protein
MNEMARILLFLWVIVGCTIVVACPDCRPVAPANDRHGTPTAPSEIKSTPFVAEEAQVVQQRYSEQLSFSVEEKPEHPVAVPEDVLQILRRNERNRRLAQGEAPASWFVASEIHLNDDDLPDLIVMPSNPRLLGANIGPFWVFRNTPRGHELVLSESALVLDVLDTRTNSLRDLRLIALSAKEKFTVTYKFDGTAYQAGRSSQEPIRD